MMEFSGKYFWSFSVKGILNHCNDLIHAAVSLFNGISHSSDLQSS